jgi:hypothetical protein
VKQFLAATALVTLLAVPAFAEDTDPTLEVRVWRIEFPDGERGDIDWEAVFAALSEPVNAATDVPGREMPGRGKPLLAGPVPVTRREMVSKRSAAPAAPRPSARSPRLNSYPVRHRDPAEVDHVVKQLTGQISADPTHGTVTGRDVTRDWRDPVRTVPDPETGLILEIGLPQPGPAAPPAGASPPPPPPETGPASIDLQTPLTPDLANIGPLDLASLVEQLKTQGRLEKIYARTRSLTEARSVHFTLPYVHSRHEGESFTVATELGVVPQSLAGNRWVLRLKPQFLTFEQAPRTIRLLTEGLITLEAGEVVVLSHILATEVAEAPSMFNKNPVSSRTLVLLSRSAAAANGTGGTPAAP